MKLAVMATGQVRSIDGLSELRAFVDRLSDMGFDVDCFVSTWSVAGCKSSGSFNYTQLARILGEKVASSIPCDCWEQPFSDLITEFLRLVNPPSITAEYLHDCIPQCIPDVEASNLLALRMPPPCFDRNSLRLVYKIWRVIQMMLARESSIGQQYDYILRCRLDQQFPLGFPESLTRLEMNQVFVDFIAQDVSGDNILFGSRADILRLVESLFSRIVATSHWDGIHVEIVKLARLLNLQLLVPAHCPRLLSDQINLSDFCHFLRSSLSIDANTPRTFTSAYCDESLDRVKSVLYAAISTELSLDQGYHLDGAQAALAPLNLDMSWLIDYAGLFRLLSRLYSGYADCFCLLSGIFYISMIGSSFKGFVDRCSRRFIVWDAVKVLLSAGNSLSCLPQLCLAGLSDASPVLLRHGINVNQIRVLLESIDGNSLFLLCSEDYETAREICAIIDRSGNQLSSLSYALVLYGRYGEREDLIELLFHLYMLLDMPSEANALKVSLHGDYGSNSVISRAMAWIAAF